MSAPPIRTRIRAVDSEQPDVRAIAAAAAVVEAGGLVAFPTESFYGLGADALDSDAVARVFEVKGRPEDKALLVLVDSIDMAAGLAARISDGARALMARYWPGPLTLVLEAADRVPAGLTGGGSTIGVRMPGHAVARALVHSAGRPITAPSANPERRAAPAHRGRGARVLRGAGGADPRRGADRGRRGLDRRGLHGVAPPDPPAGPGDRRGGMRITGVIQAGGRSVRMGGRPKALMELGGRRIIDRVADVVRAVADDVLVVTNTPELYASLGLPMVPDAFPDHGSLGGIYSGLRAARGDAAFTVACDMPFLMVEVARLVTARAAEADVVVPRVGAQWETLHACYGKACLAPIETRLRAGRLKIVGFYEDVRVLAIGEDEVARHRAPEVVFMNVNTPEDLEAARGLLPTLEPGPAPAGPR